MGTYRLSQPYFDDGFDALINFDMQKNLDKGAACFSQMADTYQSYADTIANEKDFNPVSYMSSHDTELFFSRFKDYGMQRNAANALLLSLVLFRFIMVMKLVVTLVLTRMTSTKAHVLTWCGSYRMRSKRCSNTGKPLVSSVKRIQRLVQVSIK